MYVIQFNVVMEKSPFFPEVRELRVEFVFTLFQRHLRVWVGYLCEFTVWCLPIETSLQITLQADDVVTLCHTCESSGQIAIKTQDLFFDEVTTKMHHDALTSSLPQMMSFCLNMAVFKNSQPVIGIYIIIIIYNIYYI